MLYTFILFFFIHFCSWIIFSDEYCLYYILIIMDYCLSSMWQFPVTLFVLYNLDSNILQCANTILTGHNYKLFSIEFTHVFYADVFWPSHIRFKLIANITARNVCEDMYLILFFFIVSLWWVIRQCKLGPFTSDQFLIWSLSMQRFKYCVASFSISSLVRFIYYTLCLLMFKY